MRKPSPSHNDTVEVVEPPRDRGLTAAWLNAVVVAGLVRLVFFPLAWASNWLNTTTASSPGNGFFDIWARWDAAILLRIAEVGYTDAADGNAEAFFPLFPLIVRAVAVLGIPYLAAGLLVSALSSVVALAYLWRIAEEELGEGAGTRAQLYLAFFPTSVFLIAPYTEALFLAGAIPAFYYARRNRWLHAALPAAVATGARFAGVFLLAGLAVEFLRQRRYDIASVARASAAFVAGLAPLFAYMLYLGMTDRGALAFVRAQKDGWGREFVGPWRAFIATLHTGMSDNPAQWIFAWKIEIGAAFLGVALVLYAAWKREWGYAMFMATTMGVLVTSSWYYSIPRMLLSLFPIVLFLAARTRTRNREHEVALIALTAVSALGVILFTRHLWFF